MSCDDDRDLRERFAAMQRHEAADAPTYTEIRERRASVRAAAAPRRVHWWAPALAAAAAVVATWLAIPPAPPPVPPAWTPGQWAMPTDVLLDLSGLPGDGLLRALPAIGPIDPGAPDDAHIDNTDDTKGRYEV
jgi:hypothetical protein